MEDVDRITLTTLRNIGCEFSFDQVGQGSDDDSKHFEALTPDDLVQATSKCLALILEQEGTEEFNFSTLPSAMSARFKVAQSLASAVQRLEYKGSTAIGYQTFLYPNLRDTRSLLLFLVSKLPSSGATGAAALDEFSVSRNLLPSLSQLVRFSITQLPWLPALCKVDGVRMCDKHPILESSSKVMPFLPSSILPCSSLPSAQDFTDPRVNRFIPPVGKHLLQQSQGELLATVVLWLDALHLPTANRSVANMQSRLSVLQRSTAMKSNLLKSFQLGEKIYRTALKQAPPVRPRHVLAVTATENHLQTSNSESQEDPQTRRARLEAELTDLREQVSNFSSNLVDLESELQRLVTELDVLAQEQEDSGRRVNSQQAALQKKQKVALFLPEAEEKANEARERVAAKREQLATLEREWNTRKEPLQRTLEELRAQAAAQHSPEKQLGLEIQSMVTQMQTSQQQIQEVSVLVQQLQIRAQKLRSQPGMSRADYTKRIMELTGSIRRQQLEIEKTLQDLMQLQREINLLRGKLERTFLVTDELMSKEVAQQKVGEQRATKMQTHLRHAHEHSSTVMDTVADRGRLQRETRDLDELITVEERKNTAENLNKIRQDHTEILNNVKELKRRLKSSLAATVQERG